MACPSLQYFSTSSHKRHDFRKKKKNMEYEVCVLIFCTTLTETFLILRRILRHIFINVQRSSCRVPVIMDRFYWNSNILDRFSKNIQISNVMEIRPVGAELFHAEGRTDLAKLIVAFWSFVKAPKN